MRVMRYIELDFPVERLNPVALAEGNSKKPIYQMHKWWARRLGSVFRMITLAAFAPPDVPEETLWGWFLAQADSLRYEDKEEMAGEAQAIGKALAETAPCVRQLALF